MCSGQSGGELRDVLPDGVEPPLLRLLSRDHLRQHLLKISYLRVEKCSGAQRMVGPPQKGASRARPCPSQ